MLSSAIACGVLLGVFEGVGVLISRVFSEGTRPQMPQSTFHILTSLIVLTSGKSPPLLRLVQHRYIIHILFLASHPTSVISMDNS